MSEPSLHSRGSTEEPGEDVSRLHTQPLLSAFPASAAQDTALQADSEQPCPLCPVPSAPALAVEQDSSIAECIEQSEKERLAQLSTWPVLPATPARETPISAVSVRPAELASTAEATGAAQRPRVWRAAVLPYLGSRLIVLIVGLFATYYIMPLLSHVATLPAPASKMAFPQALWLMWDHFDTGFYIQIAMHNYYQGSLHRQTDWVFYPFYPLLISGMAKLLGASNAAYYIAGVLISNLAGVFMMVYLYLLVRREFASKIASRTVIYLALFPTAFYFSAIFTESLLLGLCIACIYYTRRQQWWLAGLCGGLASLTRLQGVTLIVPLAWEYLRVVSERYAPLPEQLPTAWRARLLLRVQLYGRGLQLAARELKNWLNALFLGLVPCGLLSFMAFGQIYINDFFATFHASAWGWRRQVSPPWRLLIYSLRNPILGQPLNWNFWVFNIVVAFAGLAVIAWSWRRLPMVYTLYTAVMVLLPLSSSLLNSYGRYALLIFPAFMLLATFTVKENGKEEHLHTFVVAGFAALEAVFMIFFVLGFPTIA